jgi:hypothetical protein
VKCQLLRCTVLQLLNFFKPHMYTIYILLLLAYTYLVNPPAAVVAVVRVPAAPALPCAPVAAAAAALPLPAGLGTLQACCQESAGAAALTRHQPAGKCKGRDTVAGKCHVTINASLLSGISRCSSAKTSSACRKVCRNSCRKAQCYECQQYCVNVELQHVISRWYVASLQDTRQ